MPCIISVTWVFMRRVPGPVVLPPTSTCDSRSYRSMTSGPFCREKLARFPTGIMPPSARSKTMFCSFCMLARSSSSSCSRMSTSRSSALNLPRARLLSAACTVRAACRGEIP